ncbi:HD-GYP domain-containing protein [Desulfosporosinus sp. Sb-LF]|nr:HD-GYP domain-containing protein [Desulfosporosinus sp. Sb-LF]
MSGYIPISEKNKFDQELINSNFDRSKNLNFILFMVSMVLLFTDRLNMQKGLWTLLPGYKYLFYTHLLLFLIMLILLPFFHIYRDIEPKQIRCKLLIVLLLAYFVILDCALTSIVDQCIHGEITVFIIGAFAIAIMNNFKPLTSLGVYLTNYSIFIIGITFIQKNPAILRGHYVNGTILAVVAWFLSIILYNAKVKDFLSRKTIEHQKTELEKANQLLTTTNHNLHESLSALDESQNIIFTLTLALESKDPYSHGHSERVKDYALELARFLDLSKVDQVNIYRAAILHDIGKIGIPDAILNKPSALTREEWLIMKSHPERGETICSKLNFAREILPIIRHHHERYDGKGYPDGLSGENIPFLARLVSIADTVDAITSSRPYRSAGTFEQVLEELQKCAGTQFDPVLVSAFISLLNDKNGKIQDQNIKLIDL